MKKIRKSSSAIIMLIFLFVSGMSVFAYLSPASQAREAESGGGSSGGSSSGGSGSGKSKSGSSKSEDGGSSSKSGSGSISSGSSGSSSSNRGSSVNSGSGSLSSGSGSGSSQSGEDNGKNSNSGQSGKNIDERTGKKMEDLAKRIDRVLEHINRFESNGGVTTEFRSELDSVRARSGEAERLVAAGDFDGALTVLTEAKKEANRLNDQVEIGLGEEDQNEVEFEHGIETEIENELEQLGDVRREDRRQDGDGVEIEVETEDGVESKTFGSENALLHRSVVASTVLDLLDTARHNEIDDLNIGKQIRLVALEQNDLRDQISQSLEDIEAREGLTKFLFGPEFQEIEAAKDALAESEENVAQLELLKDQIEVPEAENELEAEIDNLKKEDQRVAGVLEQEENETSVLGWLVRMF